MSGECGRRLVPKFSVSFENSVRKYVKIMILQLKDLFSSEALKVVKLENYSLPNPS
jgi:hypothetical protein